MSLKDAAQHLQSYGRHGDTMLAHINPEEAALLKARGGSGTINPNTGLPEFWNPLSLKSWTGSEGLDLGGKNSGIASLALGALLGPAGYNLSTGMAGLATGAAMGLATGSLQKGIMAGLSAYGGAGLAEGIMNLGASGAAQAMNPQLTTGEIAREIGQEGFVKPGIMDTLGSAGKAFMDKPMDALKTIGGSGGLSQTAKYGLAATLPIMAGAGVPTTTSMPTNSSMAPGYVRPFDYDIRTGRLTQLAPMPTSRLYAEGGVVEPSEDGNVHAFGGGWMSDIVRDIRAALDRQKTVTPAQPQLQQPAFLDRGRQADIQQQMINDFQQRFMQQQAAQQAQQQALTAPFQQPTTQAQGALSQALAYTPQRPTPTINPMTGDSAAAFNYLMGKSDYPYITQDKEVFRPYTEILAQKAAAQPASAQSLGTGMQGIGNSIHDMPTPMPEVRFPQQPAAPAPVPAPIRTPEDTGIDTNQTPYYAQGGIAAAADHYNLGGYSDGGRLLRGPGDGVSDDIPATIGKNRQPARLADGEFVVPARIVSELGNGSTEAGARKLYAMMDRIQKARSKTVGKGRVAKNTRADKHLPA